MKNNTSILRGAAFALAISVLAPIHAQSDALPHTPMPANKDSKLSHGDKAFLEKAAKAGRKEVAVSQTVMDRLGNPEARNFAQMMVADHTAANTELMALAARKGVELPADKSMKIEEKWSKKDNDVQKDYLKEMEDDHQEAVQLFEKATRSDDADIAAFARKTLPTLQHHQMQVKSLRQTIAR